MQTYVFSAKKNAFFPIALKAAYEQSGTWPDDGIEIDGSIADDFMQEPPEGKVRGVDENGYPVWLDIPLPSPEELVADAESKRGVLLNEAQSTISLWQTELQLGIISDDDKASLIMWMKYIQALNAVDTSTAPDIEWPVKPE
ncbi:tail fiber assembly protein [Salmonella enterica subsp. enterica serovar Banana]|nr:tail fiber assembly protein [Salmonella enterica subsp. enterica serovar Banana]EIN1875071.1 tail fiber assembly protein [Salmonella enterica subsp. enterica serovar Banana]EIN1891840.1 tail fiber assembly protein [Salmonella enterica subsp. enterica serovar Banana]